MRFGVFVKIGFEFLRIQRIPFVIGVSSKELGNSLAEVLVGNGVEPAFPQIPECLQFHTGAQVTMRSTAILSLNPMALSGGR